MKRIMSLLLVVMFSASACCTMLRSSNQVVDVKSTPEGATASVQPGGETVTTPAKVSLQRSGSYVVQIEKQGYKPASMTLQSRTSSEMWWRNLIWLNPVFWVVGWIVDSSTGRGRELEPNTLDVSLVPAQ